MSLPVKKDDNPFLRFVREKGHKQRLPLMKFRKGKYFVGTNEVPLEREFIAVVLELRYGFVKFVNNEHAGESLIRVADGVAWPCREDLGDLDKALWERDKQGPKDPWVEQFYLPLQDVESGENFAFVAASKGTHDAVYDLLGTYGDNRHKGMPIIALAVSGYKHKDFGWVDTPPAQGHRVATHRGPDARHHRAQGPGGAPHRPRNGSPGRGRGPRGGDRPSRRRP
jgi:hypothetical protein